MSRKTSWRDMHAPDYVVCGHPSFFLSFFVFSFSFLFSFLMVFPSPCRITLLLLCTLVPSFFLSRPLSLLSPLWASSGRSETIFLYLFNFVTSVLLHFVYHGHRTLHSFWVAFLLLCVLYGLCCRWQLLGRYSCCVFT